MAKQKTGVVIMLDEAMINALKTGAVVTTVDGVSIIIKDGKAHIAKPNTRAVKYNRAEMPVESGGDVFRLSQDEARAAIKAWQDGTLPIVVGRTKGKGESRSDFDSCSIKVKVWIQPRANGCEPMNSNGNDFDNWIIEKIDVEQANTYEIGEEVTIAKAIEAVTF